MEYLNLKRMLRHRPKGRRKPNRRTAKGGWHLVLYLTLFSFFLYHLF